MKKMLYAAAAMLTLMAASCGKSENAAPEFFPASDVDSLTTAFAQVVGANLNMQINSAMATDSTVTKEAFIKGLQYALACDTNDTYMNGMIVGLQIQRQLSNFAHQGVKVDRHKLLDEFKAAFLVDTVPTHEQMTLLDNNYRMWNDSLNSARRNYERTLLENAPEALENVAKGEAFIKEVMAKDADVKLADNGVAYKIEDAGAEPKLGENTRALLNYTATTADGTVVDARQGMPLSMAARTPGLREGVKMLGKGGKATLYVPGRLAYGVEVPQNVNVGPNELIIYTVEIADIPEAPQMPR